MNPTVREWVVFLERALENRVRPDKFDVLAHRLHARSPLPGKILAELLIRPREPGAQLLDPLIPVYLERLLTQGRLSSADVLRSAFRWSRDRPLKREGDPVPVKGSRSQWRNPPELDEIIFHRVARAYATGEAPKKPKETREVLRISAEWMQLMVSNHTNDSMLQAMTGAVQPVQLQSLLVREALGLLLLALMENAKVTEFFSSPEFLKDERKQLSQALSTFTAFLASSSMQTANRLKAFQEAHGLVEDSITDLTRDSGLNEHDVNALQLQAVADLPPINTRAALYVFLSALLVARPLTDDTMILSYLSMRYKGDLQSLTVDLVTASFDVLSNGMYRNESSQTMFTLRSFLNNKIPTLLTVLSAQMFPPLTPEFCITQALSHIDPNAFPSFSQAFDMSGGNNVLSDVRQDFLFACALHGLIPVESIERLLGEPPMGTLPESGKYVKNQLVAQFTANSERIEELLNDIDAVDGNAGGIVAAVTEVIRNFCTSKDPMSLKNICNSLSKRPQTLDVILQFTSPASILQPLCQLLDAWKYDEDQGEYAPVYDEFGAVLLLVLAFVHRFGLTSYDIGIPSDSFVSEYLERGHLSIMVDDLTPDQDRQLGGWLKGLFSPDSPDGVSDDLMSSCRPQEFYLLVPTLFNQLVLGCSSEALTLDTVKSGLDCVIETFLLPSLVGAITWMTSYALEQTHKDLPVVIQILHKVVRPSISGDSQAMHSTILSIVGRRLDVCLKTLQRRAHSAQELQPLIDHIKPNLNFERTAYSPTSELETWTTSPSNTLRQTIRSTVSNLVVWSATASIHLNPTNYTHRLFYVASKLLGARKTLRAILEEVKAQTETGNGSMALDIATAIICAPSTENSPIHVSWPASPVPAPLPPRTRLNLPEMLTVEFNDAADILSSDSMMAETIVRLHRRVEAQLAMAALPALVAPPILAGIAVEDADVAAAAAAVAGGLDQQSLNAMDLTGGADDLASLGLGMDMDIEGTGLHVDVSGVGTGADGLGDLSAGDLGSMDDVFSGLDMDMDMDMDMDPDLNF